MKENCGLLKCWADKALAQPTALRGAFDRARELAKEHHPKSVARIKECQFRDLRAKAGIDTEEAAGMSTTHAQLGCMTPTMITRYVKHRKGKLVKPTK